MISQLEEPPLKHRLTYLASLLRAASKKIGVVLKSAKVLFFGFRTQSKVGRIVLINLALLFVIVFIPWISEYTVNQQIYSDLRRYSEPLDPIRAGEAAADFSQYTPGAEVTSDEVALVLMVEDDSYTLTQQLALNEGKNLGEPERAAATYTVQQGETITQIAQKFELHVATILDANGIKAEDSKSIKPGTTLNIPSSDTSTSDDWLVAINKAEAEAKEKKRQEELKKQRLAKTSRALAATSSSASSGYGGVDSSNLAIPPISSRGISQGYSSRHRGVDYMADIGTGVASAGGGKVVIISTGWSGGYGNQIVIDHGGGRATRYAHLSSISVGVGETVGRGEIIGRSGNSGRSTGPHLHFEVIVNGNPVRF